MGFGYEAECQISTREKAPGQLVSANSARKNTVVAHISITIGELESTAISGAPLILVEYTYQSWYNQGYLYHDLSSNK